MGWFEVRSPGKYCSLFSDALAWIGAAVQMQRFNTIAPLAAAKWKGLKE
jgi:hypothetical protein